MPAGSSKLSLLHALHVRLAVETSKAVAVPLSQITEGLCIQLAVDG
jgi:hypothetical protein